MHQIIPRLLTIVRDKVGNLRKNAAILLAKLAKEEKNLPRYTRLLINYSQAIASSKDIKKYALGISLLISVNMPFLI